VGRTARCPGYFEKMKSSIIRIVFAAILTFGLSACAEVYSPMPWTGPAKSAPAHPASYWVGKQISEAASTLGPPSSVEYIHGSGLNAGGKTYMFTNPGQPHYIFQTDPGSTVIKSAQAIN
jgi:hypothetical protein